VDNTLQQQQRKLGKLPEIDIIVRGEGEKTFAELVEAYEKGKPISNVKGLSTRHNGKVYHTPQRPLIKDLDSLPFPGYHLVEDVVHKYHFTMMAGSSTRYALIEGSRGCLHNCSFCSQWVFWQGKWRVKSPKRIVDEMQFFMRIMESVFLAYRRQLRLRQTHQRAV